MGVKELIHARIAKSEMQKTVDRLLEASSLRAGFFIHLFLSAGIATLGLLEGNTAIVIGAMVIAPLLTPLLCLSLGVLSFKPKMIIYGLQATVLGSVLGILSGAAIVFLFGKTTVPAELLDLYTFHNYDFLMIALLSGMAGAYASLNPRRNEELIGVAIAAALVPPLAFAGIALGLQEMELFKDVLVLYLVNLLATSIGAMIVYGLFLAKNKVDPEEIVEKDVN